MRITIFVPTLHGGGAERVAIDLAREFVRSGHETDLSVGTLAGAELRGEVHASVNLIDLDCARLRLAVPRFARHLRDRRPDAVLSLMSHTNAVAAAAVASVFPRPRLVVSEHNNRSEALLELPYRHRLVMRGAMWWTFRRADAVVGVSRGVTEDLVANFGVDRVKAVSIHNPVNAGRLTATSGRPSGHPWLDSDGEPVILSAGRLEPQKDFSRLIHAVADVRARHPVRLIILGDGPQRVALESIARQRGVAEAVDLPGFVDNIGAFLAAADVFVLSSIREGFANVVAEALVVGTPVVSTDCPHGPAEILENGRWGRLVPVGDTAALASGIERALRGDVPAPPPDAASLFAPERVAAAYLEVLNAA